MRKFKARAAATVEDLLAASHRETRATAARRWIVNNPIPSIVANVAVSVWLFMAIDIQALIAFTAPVLVTVVFLVFPLIAQLWRLRAELLIVGVVGVEWRLLSEFWFATLIATQAIVLVSVPQLRRFSEKQFWCVVTNHRLRGVLQRVAVGRKVARTPTVLWTKATPVGEHVTIWLPSGLAIKDLEGQLSQIAAACWAKHARINPNKKYSQLVSIDVIRRDQLGDAIESEIASEFTGKISETELETVDKKVDEFLKTITIHDVKTKEPPLPVSGPVNGSIPKQRTKQTAPSFEADDPF